MTTPAGVEPPSLDEAGDQGGSHPRDIPDQHLSVGGSSSNGGAGSKLIGQHETMVRLRGEVARAAASDSPVVIHGETGTGKELVAQYLHAASGRRGEMVAINVATLDNQVADSELFGAERGAYTGAHASRPGLVERAANGTLVLDEAGDLALSLQAKLLRALETGAVRRVGGGTERRIRFRIIVTTQRSPASLVRTGTWRPDFYYRVAGLVIRVPSLADRRSDIPVLAGHFMGELRRPPLTAAATAGLMNYSWPGNVRELKRTLERSIHIAGSEPVGPDHIEEALEQEQAEFDSPIGSLLDLDTRSGVARREIEQALKGARTLADAARQLGVSERTLYRRMKSLGVPRRRLL